MYASIEFDNQGKVVSLTEAKAGTFGDDESWMLTQGVRTEFTNGPDQVSKVDQVAFESFRWPTQISAEMVAAAVLRPERMGTIDLFQYIRHLNANGQSRAEVRNPVLEKGVLSAELPGDGGVVAALCLPAFPLRQHCGLHLWRRDGGHQLCAAEQRAQ